MDATSPADATLDAPVVFRGKKRKVFRPRSTEEEGASQPNTATETVEKQEESAGKDEAPEGSEAGRLVAEIIRRRNARKSRLKGVGFGTDDAQGTAADADDELSLMIREEEQKAIDLANGGVSKRFTAQTGLSSELVDKHMMEFIESEIAKRKSAASSSHGASLGPSSSDTGITFDNKQDSTRYTIPQGTLQEIDLGDEVRRKNEAMTDRAWRKLQGESVEHEQAPRPKKIRLGRDGKPWRSRNRRNSDDIKLDQLVEEILRENRLDVYETPTPPAATTPGLEDDGAADDRIAEEFRREFLEAMAERQQKKKQPAAGAKKDEEVLKGPKLGGSRNARAAMRDLMLKKEKEGKR
ncbi:hypothetical protein SCUP515_08692 [Seiridium cupressi]